MEVKDRVFAQKSLLQWIGGDHSFPSRQSRHLHWTLSVKDVSTVPLKFNCSTCVAGEQTKVTSDYDAFELMDLEGPRHCPGEGYKGIGMSQGRPKYIGLSEQSTNCNNILNILRRLVCGAAVYYIWQERNARIFGNGKKDEKMLCKVIKETIRMRLLSLQVKESKAMKMVELQWNVKLNRFNRK
ncbi:hypothetical protein Tco_0073886 [Tanacetum coccineum]